MNPIARVTVLTLVASALWLLQRKAKPRPTLAAPTSRRAGSSPWWHKRPYPALDSRPWQPRSAQAYLRPVTSW